MTAALLVVLTLCCPAPEPTVAYYQQVAEVCAGVYDLDADYLCCVAQAESNWNPGAYNKKEGAAGLFQWRPESWRLARNAMRVDDDLRLRFDALENIVTTCYAMKRGWNHWWLNADRICQPCLDRESRWEYNEVVSD